MDITRKLTIRDLLATLIAAVVPFIGYSAPRVPGGQVARLCG